MRYFFGEGRGGQGSEEDLDPKPGKGRTEEATEKQTAEAQPGCSQSRKFCSVLFLNSTAGESKPVLAYHLD